MHAEYIIMAMNYLNKWAKAKTITKNDAQTMTKFLHEDVLRGYGMPIESVGISSMKLYLFG